ncbi:MAG: ABC transporter permease subunit [Actinobacteria bacterium]|nr:ABC transporter permease subunit [Actinomycetota bacterium]
MSERLRGYAFGAAGLLGLVALWWLLQATVFADKLVPSPWGVLTTYGDDGFTFYRNNFTSTVEESLRGFAYGNGLALLLASVVLLVPQLERVITQIAIISYCIPLVAITPILYVVLGGADGVGEPSPTAVALAAVSCFFTTLVGAVLGFRSADPASLDVVSVYGGGRFQQLRKVQLVSALPAIISSLQIAAPAAFLGAVLGEYIGGVDRGVAPALINAAQNLNDERAWGLMLVSGLVAGVGYGFFSVLARFVTPWSKGAAS